MYVDLGARSDETEFHVTFTGADNKLGAVAATPVELLNQRWSSVYTWPQTTQLQLAFLTASLNLQRRPTPGRSRAMPISAASGSPMSTATAPMRSRAIRRTPTWQSASATTSTPISTSRRPRRRTRWAARSWARSTATGPPPTAFGGSAQVTNTDKLFGHDNHFVVGISVDHGNTKFNRQQRTRHGRPEPVRDRHRRLHRPAGRRPQPGQPARAPTPIPASTRPTRSTSPRGSRSRRAAGSTSPRSTCRTRPGPIRCSTAATSSSASIR